MQEVGGGGVGQSVWDRGRGVYGILTHLLLSVKVYEMQLHSSLAEQQNTYCRQWYYRLC